MMHKSKKIIMAIFLIALLTTILIGVFSVFYVLVPYNDRRITPISEDAKISINSFDGFELLAEKITYCEESHNWVILVHSYRTDHTVMYPYAEEYLDKGYNVLLPDNRAHGNSEGLFIGMGYLDQFDLADWVDYIISLDADANIIIHGLSMGAATAMMYSGGEDIPINVKAIIEDCGYTSAFDYLSWKLKQRFNLPDVPIISIANISFKIAAGYFMNQASAIDAVKQSEIPILFIHGTEDTTVPVENVYSLYNAAENCEKDLYIVEGAKHGESLNVSPLDYWSHVFDFVNRYLN